MGFEIGLIAEVRLPINHWTLKMRNVVYSLVILFCSYIFLKISAQELFQNLFLTVNFSSLELKYRTHHSCSIVGLWFSFIQDFLQKHFHFNRIMKQSNFQVAYELILTIFCKPIHEWFGLYIFKIEIVKI
jgi:hypothetical protein